MIDAPTRTLLQTIFRRENRSLLQYLAESFPWTPPDLQGAVAQMQKLAAEEREGAARLADFLHRHHVALPYLGAFPEPFTALGFIALDYAVPRLVRAEQDAVAELQRDLLVIKDAEARTLIQELIAEKERHVKDLENLAAELPAATRR